MIDDDELERRANAPDSEFVPAVTSSMVDRACETWFKEYAPHDWEWHKIIGDTERIRNKMRSALEAALYVTEG